MPMDIEKQFPNQWKNDDEEGGKNLFEEELLRAQLKRLKKDGLKVSYTKILNNNAGQELVNNMHNLLGNDLNVIALIGIILLIGIVKKNAILMIDFAVNASRVDNKTPEEAIFQACLLRFRPIMMTTMAALLGGLPLALGGGTGSELRRPLGIAIVGGLIVSQALTLFTTPVIYIYFDRAGRQFREWRARRRAGHAGPEPEPAE
jgi:hypothetical protein